MLVLVTTMSLMMSLTLMFVRHPLIMGLVLLIQTTLVSLITGFLNNNYWYSYILFLVMIGGMLVLFIYMTSVASNEKFKFSSKILLMLLCIAILSTFMFFMLDIYYFYISNISMESLNYPIFKHQLTLNKYLNYPMSSIYFILIIYLLITLIAVVKITDFKNGPLRQSKR
uniref:NADH-ubiquinone oxidoreductase chain 6 n=1 Tax=Trox sp. TRO01 TaxID=1205588 RepID=A0A0S2MNB4_9SCAR|nr:NADH deshydrogenase subunit 6 [Trox sp. TRO01]